MATEERLIDAERFKRILQNTDRHLKGFGQHKMSELIESIIKNLDLQPTVDAVEVPCKICDWVWAIRSYHGHKHPQRGIVSDMYFSNDMRLHIVVKHVARGEWGKTVFATDKEAYAAIGGRKYNG